MHRLRRFLAIACLIVCAPVQAEEPVRVFAAASLTDVLEDVATQWQQRGHRRPLVATGASSTLARQVEAGAPADVYISADRAWMDYLAQRGRIATNGRVDLLGNALVLVAPKGRGFAVPMRPDFSLARAFKGRLCMAEPQLVPAGIYARQALEKMGWWAELKGRIVASDDVRAALTFVERGECAAGIVYATDARVSDKVEVLAQFPASTHTPIVYSFAVVRGARPPASAFLTWLRGPEASEIFRRHGFLVRGQ